PASPPARPGATRTRTRPRDRTARRATAPPRLRPPPARPRGRRAQPPTRCRSAFPSDDTARRAPVRRILRPMRVIAIFGPTGVGKTAVAIALADRLRAPGEDPGAISAAA